MEFNRSREGTRFVFGGLKTNSLPDSMPTGKFPLAINVRAISESSIQTRPGQSRKFSTGGNPITDINSYVALNTDDLPRYLARDSADGIWLDNSVQVGTLAGGGSNLGCAMLTLRPNASPVPYIYAANGFDMQKFSAPDALNNVIAQKAGIAEPQSPPNAGVQIVGFANVTGVAGNYTQAGTAGAPSNASQGIAGETITQVVADPVALNAWSIGISGFGGVSTFALGQVVNSGAQSYFVQDWINPNLSASITIAAIAYYSGTTGHCVIVPSGLGNSPSAPAFTDGNPSQPSIFSLSDTVPSIRRGALLQLSGEVVYVLSVSQGPNGQISIETSTVNAHVANESFTLIPTLLVTAGSVAAPVVGNSVSTDAILSSITGAGVGTLTRGSFNPFSGVTFGGTGIQEDDLICIFLHSSVATGFTEMRILFDVGDGTFGTNYLYYSITPSAFTDALSGASTALADAQLAAQQSGIQGSIPGAGTPLAPGGWFTPIVFRIGDMTRVGNNGNSVASTAAVQIWVNAASAMQLGFGSITLFGGGAADVGEIGSPYFYRVRPRSSITGVVGNPSPSTRYGMSPRREQVRVTLPSPAYDGQIDTWDIFRFGGTVTSWRYIGSITSTHVSFIDNFTDDAALAGDALDFDNFEPWPTIDIPNNGTASVVCGTLAIISTTNANVLRYLPGTLVQIAGQNAYTLWTRPVSLGGGNYLLQFVENAGPATNVSYTIKEPAFANQHLPYMWGPDVAGTVFAVGDPLRLGTLYFCKPFAPDSAPDVNNQEITSPDEPLIGGEILDGLSFVASSERWWALYPQPGSPQPYNVVQQPFPRGLGAPHGHTTDGTAIFYWAKDGIQSSIQGSLTDADLYNLFPHDGVPGKTVTYNGTTITPPDYSRASSFRLAYANYYLYATYQDSTGTYRCLTLDTRRMAWAVDIYSPAVSVVFHPKQQAGTLATSTALYDEVTMGTVDGRVVAQTDNTNDLGGPIAVTLAVKEEDGGDIRAPKQWGDVFLDATPVSPILAQPMYLGAPIASPTTFAANPVRQRKPLDLGGIVVSDFLGLQLTWTDDFTAQSTPSQVHVWQPSSVIQPARTLAYSTFGTSFGLQGYGHIRRIAAAWVSTAPIVITITTFDGQSPQAFTIPSSGGQYQKQLFSVSANKGQLFYFRATSTAPFQLFFDDCEVHVGGWARTDGYAILKGFGGRTINAGAV